MKIGKNCELSNENFYRPVAIRVLIDPSETNQKLTEEGCLIHFGQKMKLGAIRPSVRPSVHPSIKRENRLEFM